MWGFGMWATVAIPLAVGAIILLLCLFISTNFVILCLVLVVALLSPAAGRTNGQVVDIGLVEKPFQHTCLYHLQDCVVNGD